MAEGIVTVAVPYLPQHIYHIEMQDVLLQAPVGSDVQGNYQGACLVLRVDTAPGTEVQARYNTLIGGTVSPMSDWSNSALVKAVPEPGLTAGLMVGAVALALLVKWRGAQ